MKKDLVIAIDGPSGSGKSTVSKQVAKNLGLIYIDTGAMFRALAYAFSENGLVFETSELKEDEEKKIDEFIKHHRFHYAPSDDKLITFDGHDLSQKIRQHRISHTASLISKYQIVRNFIQNWQRNIVKNQPAILDGRDIGTVIFPQAILKIFLTASSKERAKRRFMELQNQGLEKIDFQTVLTDIEQRDHEDMTRQIAPLKKSTDCVEIDTTGKSIFDIVDEITTLWKQRTSS